MIVAYAIRLVPGDSVPEESVEERKFLPRKEPRIRDIHLPRKIQVIIRGDAVRLGDPKCNADNPGANRKMPEILCEFIC